MSESLRLSGFRELDQKLGQLGEEVARRIVFQAVREGADLIRDEARARVPKDSGVTARNIRTRMSRRSKGAVEARIGTTKRAWYARLVEHGTAPHKITAKHAKVLANKATGRFFGKTVKHPGTAPRPFLRPALEARADQAIVKIGRAIWWGITTHTRPNI